MSYCPLSCSSHGYMPSCKGPECELTDEAGSCLIKQALACYVQDKREERAAREQAREQLAKSPLGNMFGSIFTSEPATGVGY